MFEQVREGGMFILLDALDSPTRKKCYSLLEQQLNNGADICCATWLAYHQTTYDLKRHEGAFKAHLDELRTNTGVTHIQCPNCLGGNPEGKPTEYETKELRREVIGSYLAICKTIVDVRAETSVSVWKDKVAKAIKNCASGRVAEGEIDTRNPIRSMAILKRVSDGLEALPDGSDAKINLPAEELAVISMYR